jgi:drug/metabolite transporter (DMT)-like permease
MSRSRLSTALAALFLLSLIWGYNWVVMKRVTAYIDPFDFSALRSLFGAISLFVALAWLRRPLRVVAWGKVIALGLLQTTAFTAMVQWALVAGGAGKTAVLVYTMPFWLMLSAWWLLGERVRAVQWWAAAVAAGGLLMLLEPWSGGGSVFSNFLAVGGGLSWALATVLAKRMRSEHQYDILALTAWQMLFGAIVLCLMALLLPSSRPIDPTAYFFGAVIFNAVFATALAWVLWVFVLNHLPVATAGLSTLGIPLIGVLAGWIELGERPDTFEIGGMLLIGIALAITSLVPWWRARRRIGSGGGSRN